MSEPIRDDASGIRMAGDGGFRFEHCQFFGEMPPADQDFAARMEIMRIIDQCGATEVLRVLTEPSPS